MWFIYIVLVILWLLGMIPVFNASTVYDNTITLSYVPFIVLWPISLPTAGFGLLMIQMKNKLKRGN